MDMSPTSPHGEVAKPGLSLSLTPGPPHSSTKEPHIVPKQGGGGQVTLEACLMWAQSRGPASRCLEALAATGAGASLFQGSGAPRGRVLGNQVY